MIPFLFKVELDTYLSKWLGADVRDDKCCPSPPPVCLNSVFSGDEHVIALPVILMADPDKGH